MRRLDLTNDGPAFLTRLEIFNEPVHRADQHALSHDPAVHAAEIWDLDNGDAAPGAVGAVASVGEDLRHRLMRLVAVRAAAGLDDERHRELAMWLASGLHDRL